MNLGLRIPHCRRRAGYLSLASLLLAGICLACAASGRGASESGARAATPSPKAEPAKPPCPANSQLPCPDHIVVVIEENKGYGDIIGSANAPYLNALVTQGALLTKFYAEHHPSQPNYMEIFSGNSQGVFNDSCPKSQFSAPSLGGSLINQHLTFTGYAEDLPPPPSGPSVCEQGDYARRHCPWIDFKDVPNSASVDFASFPKTAAGFAQLPTVAFVIPNLIDDMHSAPSTTPHNAPASSQIPIEVKDGDTWLKNNLDAYAQWAKTHNSLLVITWDEDSSTYTYPTKPSQKINTKPPQNHITTILVGGVVKAGKTSSQQYNHYSLLRTIENMYGLPAIGGSQTAKPIAGIWQ